jgi:hypothetical protein
MIHHGARSHRSRGARTLSGDLTTLHPSGPWPDNLGDVVVDTTMFDGKVVYQRKLVIGR